MNTSEQAAIFCQDYLAFYDYNVTKIHTQPREESEQIQLAALQLRFEQLRNAVPMLKKLADNEKIHEIKEFNDVVPLLFDHTMYKSYPPSLLHNKRFAELTTWLNKLTTIDLSGFDGKQCHDVDEWLLALYEQTPLNAVYSSGTSGVFSFLPRTKSIWDKFMSQYLVTIFQVFGEKAELKNFPLNMHAIYPYFRSGGGHLMLNDLYVKYICGGEERFHAAYPGRLSTELLLLGARMRDASAQGQLDRLEISPDLLARRGEFIKLQEQKDEHVARFFNEISEKLKGERIFMMAVPGMLYQMAKTGLERGEKGMFARDSIIVGGGGAKGTVMPDNWDDYVKEYLGVDRVIQTLGMGEMVPFFALCEQGHYHTMPGVIPFILDPDTSQPLPRRGRVTGRWAHYDLVPDSHWGGFIAGDEVTMNWDTPCPCGRATSYLDKNIQRYSEKSKGGDKITCAATQQSYQDAMDFLISSESNG